MKMDYLFDVWETHLKKDPKGTVLSDSLGGSLSRTEVDVLSAKVHAWLQARGIGREDFVLINLDRGVKPVVAALGVWKNGSAFSLVESAYARERIAFIKENCNAKIEITEEVWPEILACEPLPGFVRADDHDACMCVYTSGTTGTPKGIIHEYGQLKMEMISEQRDDGTWRENRKTKWGLVAPLNFVASLKIVVHFVYCGGHLYVIDYNTVKNVRKLNVYFLKNRINETFLSPSLLKVRGGDFGPFMKFIYTGAEPANNVFVEGPELNNTYTMSESFFTVSEFIIDKPYPVCPIGTPRFDLDIRLIDEDGRGVEPGAVGELIFANPFCRGYVDNPEENALHFVNGYFHTADLASFENGLYTIRGRRDDMVKINGNRIEPAEIEAACVSELGLTRCVAKGFQDEGIVAVYHVDELRMTDNQAKERLAELLPYYMIPNFFVRIDALPISNSGKIDRKQLAIPVALRLAEYAAPRNETERIILEGMQKVLKIERIGIDDDFFLLGGNSLLAMDLAALLEGRLDGVELTSELLYSGGTVRRMMDIVVEQEGDLNSEEKELFGRSQHYPLRNFSLVTHGIHKAYPNSTALNLSSGYRFKKSFLLSAKKLAEAINATIRLNSQMQTVVREEDGQPYWSYEPDAYEPVVVEKMGEEEALAVAETFVAPFGKPGDARLYRIRLIETRKHIYLYADFDHLLNDGYGLSMFVGDVVSAYKGKPNKHNNFYEWLYDFEKLYASDFYREADDYFTTRYLPYLNRMNFEGKGDDENVFLRELFPVPADSAKLQAHLERYGITKSILANTVLLCALSLMNDDIRTGLLWCYNGVDGGKNHSGYRSHSLPLALLGAPYASLEDLYADMGEQTFAALKRGRFSFDYHSTFIKQCTKANLNTDYLGTLESDDTLVQMGGEHIALAQPADDEFEFTYTLVQILDAKDGFDLRVWHHTDDLSRENARVFADTCAAVMSLLLAGELPKLPGMPEPSE